MDRLQKVPKEIWLAGFYITYVIASIITDKLTPSGPCTPGPGFLLYILLIPVNLVVFVFHFVKYLRGEKEYWKCLLVDLSVWPMLIVLSVCKLI